jgi:hypothetical protein
MVHSKLGQTVSITILDDAGNPKEVKMAARGRYGPVNKARLGKQTKNLIARGHMRIRTV